MKGLRASIIKYQEEKGKGKEERRRKE